MHLGGMIIVNASIRNRSYVKKKKILNIQVTDSLVTK